MTIQILGENINVYVNGEQILTYATSSELKPIKYNMKTQSDRSSIKFLNTEYQMTLPKGIMGYNEIQSTRDTNFAFESIVKAPLLGSFLEIYQVGIQ